MSTAFSGEPWREERGHALLPGRRRVLRAARALMSRDGVEATEVGDVAAAAGLGIDAMRCLFESKEALLDALADEAVRVNGGMVERVAAADADPAEVVASSVRHTVRLADADAVHAWLLRNDDRYAEALTEDLACRLLRSLSRGVWVGRFTISSVLVQHRAIQGAVLAVLRAKPQGKLPPDTPEELATGILQMLGLPWEEAAAIATRAIPPAAPWAGTTTAADEPCRSHHRPAPPRRPSGPPSLRHPRNRR